MSRRVYDAVATVGEYTDRQTGEKKKRVLKIGTVFHGEDGRMSMKLDAVPVGQDWSGWVSFYEPKNQQASAPQAGREDPW